MYSVDHRDRVVELRDLPHSLIGAPLPAALAVEDRVLLAYLVQGVHPAWDGPTMRPVGPAAADEIVALVRCARGGRAL